MARSRPFVVVSGLPGSGKSMLAAALGPALGVEVLDKDDVLERTFDGLDTIDAEDRQKLSRLADDELRRLVGGLSGAVIVSFW